MGALVSKEKLQANLNTIQERIAIAAQRVGRDPEDVTLVAVTKTVGIDEARDLYELGITHFGENRIEVGQAKVEALQGLPICWHMIGSLQRRKAREAVALFDCIDAIDRIALAEAVQKRCEEQDRTVKALIEVNVSGEEAKHGFPPEEVAAALDAIARFERIEAEGLMTMAPFVEDPELTRPVFARLRELGRRLGLPELSMGMTNDFEVAVEEGATQVRIGTALFA
ncbi:MAG TPA: YggS family pyridoxal phosphate-dependent enzyme [Candidatus Hydrogenedentes bacterium]|nr:YggS family pyridoxal phosphate-dependent enzyme [Candidatus Hydrogenedentota bacterium]HPG65319.1 YggS family pyridoxal phosphate-dependent enzyme [Candidatus Hydrogenedentota bacterium]